LTISDVCTKYQEAAKIVNLALQGLIEQCVPGAKVIELCEFGHSILNKSAAKLYTKKSNGAVMDRGVAFPVCVSVNDVVCNDSPLLSEERVRCVTLRQSAFPSFGFSLARRLLVGS
jgi:methionine aminopeptidase